MDALQFFVPAFVVVGLALILWLADNAGPNVRSVGRQIGGAFVILTGLLFLGGVILLIAA